MTEYFLFSLGASVLLPVTPRRTTGFSGRTAYSMYEFQSHRGEELCETMMDSHTLTHQRLGIRWLSVARRCFASGEGLSLRNASRHTLNHLQLTGCLHRPAVDHHRPAVGPEVHSRGRRGIPLVEMLPHRFWLAVCRDGGRRHSWRRKVHGDLLREPRFGVR